VRVLMLNYPRATFRDCPDFAIGHSGQAGKPASSQTLINNQHHKRRGKTRTFTSVWLQVNCSVLA
jgi:hypothetical protein